MTRQDPVKNLVATRWIFFFFTKTMSFWFFKKIDPGDPVKIRNPDLGPDRIWKLCCYCWTEKIKGAEFEISLNWNDRV